MIESFGAGEGAACLVCEANDFRAHHRFETYGYVRCARCGHVRQAPMPSFAELAERYRRDYCDYEIRNEQVFLDLMLLGFEDIGFTEHARRRLAGRRFLDVGCAIGALVNVMRARGWEATGIDICGESIAHGKAKFGVDLIHADLFAAGFAAAAFDAVHSSHVIEHVLEPDRWLREIHRILRPGGVLILTTPNTSSFQCRLSGSRWRGHSPNHVQLFGRHDLRLLLEKTGFAAIKRLSWGGIPLGKAPPSLKKLIDRLAKALDLGDVQLFFCEKVQPLRSSFPRKRESNSGRGE